MRFVRRYVVLALGIGAVIAGTWVNLTAQASFGWFAYGASYAPLDESTMLVAITPRTVLSYSLIILGLVLIAGWTGYAIGQRRAAAGS